MRLLKQNPDIIILTPDNAFTDFSLLQATYPSRCLNLGISEANTISFAAGLASCGKIPFVFGITTFLSMRAFEQIRNDICLTHKNVKLIGIGAGVYYSKLGSSHHAIEDIALFSVLPSMTILSVYNLQQMKAALCTAISIQGPVYIRYNLNEGNPADITYEKQLASNDLLLRSGHDITIFTTGNIASDVLSASCILEQQGITATVIYIQTIKPINVETIKQYASYTGAVLTVEEHSVIGGLGSIVMDALIDELPTGIIFEKIGFDDIFPLGYGNHTELLARNGLSKERISESIKMLFLRKAERLKNDVE